MYLLATLTIWLFVSSSVSADCKCGRRPPKSRIVFGSPAPEGHYPWMVGIRRYTVYNDGRVRGSACGGSVLNSEYVLTAAHCVVADPQQDDNKIVQRLTYVVVGTNDNSVLSQRYLFYVDKNNTIVHRELPPGVHRADRFVAHENYDTVKLNNDVAVIHVSQPFTFGPKLSPVCLEDTRPSTAYPAIEASGWGNVRTGIQGPPQLYHVTLKEIEADSCKKVYPIVAEKQLCYRNGYSGTCQGDSGGPLVIQKHGVFYQVALVSYGGRSCEDPNVPNVGSRISFFREWIKSKAVGGSWCEP